MTRSKSKQRPPLAAPDLEDLGGFQLYQNGVTLEKGEYSGVIFEETDSSDQKVFDVLFRFAVFRRARLSGTKLRNVNIRDAVVVNSDCSVADWSEGALQRVQIAETRLTGFNGAQSRFEDVLFQNCKMHCTIFQTATFARCRFEDCDLTDATFEGATLEAVRFIGCNLASVRFIEGHLKNVDFRGSQIDGVQIALSQLHGVTIDPFQTAAIAALTSVTVLRFDESQELVRTSLVSSVPR